jgi:hypothetical protein
MKHAVMVAVVVAAVGVSAIPALAQSGKFGPRGPGSEKSGYCPAGTCAKGGGLRAINLSNCSAANCRQSGLSGAAKPKK